MVSRKVLATKRFQKNFQKFDRGYPVIRNVLIDFLDYRKTAPRNVPWSKKDYAFPSGPVKGIWHVHLFHGKVILVYDVTETTVLLYDIVEHDGIEGRAVMTLAEYVHGLQPSDFVPFEMVSGSSLPIIDRKIVADFLWELVQEDAEILHQVAEGRFDELFEYTRMMIDGDWTDSQKDAAVLRSFGGKRSFGAPPTM